MNLTSFKKELEIINEELKLNKDQDVFEKLKIRKNQIIKIINAKQNEKKFMKELEKGFNDKGEDEIEFGGLQFSEDHNKYELLYQITDKMYGDGYELVIYGESLEDIKKEFERKYSIRVSDCNNNCFTKYMNGEEKANDHCGCEYSLVYLTAKE